MLKPPGNTNNLESCIAQCAADRESTVRRIQRAVAFEQGVTMHRYSIRSTGEVGT